MGLPIHVYPLYENARRAARGQSVQHNASESAEMYSAFDKIASNNEYAWGYGERVKSAADISSVTKRNRIICEPCKLPSECAIRVVKAADRARPSPDERI